MRTPSRVLRLLGMAGLLLTILATTISPAAAQQELPSAPGMDSIFDTSAPSFRAGVNTIYYPWVANDDDFGLGPADTSISIQNLEDRDSQIWVYTGNGDNTWKLAATAYLSRYASKTFTAAQLGIASGHGAPVAVMAFNVKNVSDVSTALIETQVVLSKPAGVAGNFTQVLACVVNEHVNETIGNPYPFKAAVSFTWNGTTYAQGSLVPWTTQVQLQDILNVVNAGNTGALINPFGGLNADGDCTDRLGKIGNDTVSLFDAVAIGGVAKQAVGGESLPYTTGADTSVSGYNAINGHEVYKFNEWYLPIVQTNCGPGGCWDSTLRVANLSNLNSAVTIRFFPANDGSGSLQTGFQVQANVHGGDTWHVNLGDLVPDGWVGSAHIYSDGAVFAMVDRYKVGYNMWLTNTGSAADFENKAQVPGAGGRYALFAPHVLLDYFGWNTGINVANLYNGDNNVSIQYFNMLGNATQVLNQRLAAHGMTYFYDPSQAPQNNSGQNPVTDPNAGVVGSAVIWSDHPVAVAVDATKYPESDPRGGADVLQGTSYSATANVFTWQAVPLVQKGNPASGMGATSGINIMNPNATAATANVYWVNPSGFNAQNFGVSSVTIPAFANGFVYTMVQTNLPNGFFGAAQVVSNIPVSAVSANVDYQVEGDGSAIFNAVNPCGLYRVRMGCDFGDPIDVTGRSVTKTFVDEAGKPVPGVGFSIVGTNPAFPYQRDGVSGVDGSRMFTNVPPGTYELHVTSVPANYLLPSNPADTFTVTQGADVVLVNTLYQAQGFEKQVCVADYDLTSCSDVWLSGVNIRVYERVGSDSNGQPVVGKIVFEGKSGDKGMIGGSLPVGGYVLCMYDADGVAVTRNGETVKVDLSASGAYPVADCEPFEVKAGKITSLVNHVELLKGVLNVFVYEGNGNTTTPLAGAKVCVSGTSNCAVSNAAGRAAFTGLGTGSHSFDVQLDGMLVADARGGVFTVSSIVVSADADPATTADIDFNYNATWDIAQDGWSNDVTNNTLRGSYDLRIEMQPYVAPLPPPPVPEINAVKTTEAEEGVNEVQWYSFSDDATDTVFRFGFGGDFTIDISAATQWDQFQDALNDLDSIKNVNGQVLVTPPQGTSPGDVIGTDEAEFSIEFVSGLGKTDVNPFTIQIQNAGTRVMEYMTDPGTPNVQGAPDINQVWTVTGANITGGTFTITVEAQGYIATTAPLAFDASAATIQTEINAKMDPFLINPKATVTVSGGPIVNGPLTITVNGGLSGLGLSNLTVNGSGLN